MNSRTDALVRLSFRTAAHRDLLQERAIRCEFPLGLGAEFPVLPLRLISALAEGGDQLGADGSVT